MYKIEYELTKPIDNVNNPHVEFFETRQAMRAKLNYLLFFANLRCYRSFEKIGNEWKQIGSWFLSNRWED